MNRKTRWSAGLIAAAALTAVALTGCAPADTEAKADKPAASAPAKADPTPAPAPVVDPDTEYVTAMKGDAEFQARMITAMKQLDQFTTATGDMDLTGAVTAGHATADTYDWMADRVDSKPISSTSPAAQDAMAAFRMCRDAYDNAAQAISDVDVPAINAATGDIQACTRAVEGATAQL